MADSSEASSETSIVASSETSIAASGVERAYEIVQRMVNPGGCAWHADQTHETLTKFLIEETHEFIDTVEQSAEPSEVSEELGDVLYQVLFHAAIAERDGEGYTLDTMAHRLAEKLVARHPHVFGDRGYLSVEELHAEWEQLKEDAEGQARGTREPLEGIPAGMPTLARAAKVVERLKRAGLLDPTLVCDGETTSEAELGDALLGLVIRANASGVDPDRALRLATARLSEQAVGEATPLE